MNELIDRLKTQLTEDVLKSGHIRLDAGDLQEAITALESIPAWVKCSERLPEHGNEDYYTLVFDEIDGTWPGDPQIARWWNDHFVVAWYEKVTFWMPLPEPPKADPITESSCVEQGG
jgi:hypothetical protein